MKNIIKQVREKFALTQLQLAREMCVSLDTVKSWESGRNQIPPMALKLISVLYGVSCKPLHKYDDQPDLF